jgi:outer membrane protein assembly factor BamD (BamD/ComL family)
MFFKQVVILFIVLGVLGYAFGDYIFYEQGHYMMKNQYPIPAYEAFERLVKYYPKSKFAKEARANMEKLRNANGDLNKLLEKNEAEFTKTQKEREKIESFR